MIQSKLVTQTDFNEPFYNRWCEELAQEPILHRKQWEFVMILQALAERGMIEKGRFGLGFGVGEEPIPAVLAKHGVKVLATDLDPADPHAYLWDNGQLAKGSDNLYKQAILDRETFDGQVSYRVVNMNELPVDLLAGNFDFTWSSCSLEHLGSISKGLQFVVNQMGCLKKGGWAIHTTEFNFSSDLDTVDHQGTVLFRRSDIIALKQYLERSGYYLGPINFDTGSDVYDNYIDMPPYKSAPHLKLQLGRYKITSILLIIRR